MCVLWFEPAMRESLKPDLKHGGMTIYLRLICHSYHYPLLFASRQVLHRFAMIIPIIEKKPGSSPSPVETAVGGR